MITPVKAWELISPGDLVWYIDGGVVSCCVKKVDLDHLVVDSGRLYYCDHGTEWWLTKKVCEEKFYERESNYGADQGAGETGTYGPAFR